MTPRTMEVRDEAENSGKGRARKTILLTLGLAGFGIVALAATVTGVRAEPGLVQVKLRL